MSWVSLCVCVWRLMSLWVSAGDQRLLRGHCTGATTLPFFETSSLTETWTRPRQMDQQATWMLLSPCLHCWDYKNTLLEWHFMSVLGPSPGLHAYKAITSLTKLSPAPQKILNKRLCYFMWTYFGVLEMVYKFIITESNVFHKVFDASSYWESFLNGALGEAKETELWVSC